MTDRGAINDGYDDDDAAIEWGWGGVMMEDKEVGGWKKTPTQHRPSLSRIRFGKVWKWSGYWNLSKYC
jgi:hypothetical protein